MLTYDILTSGASTCTLPYLHHPQTEETSSSDGTTGLAIMSMFSHCSGVQVSCTLLRTKHQAKLTKVKTRNPIRIVALVLMPGFCPADCASAGRGETSTGLSNKSNTLGMSPLFQTFLQVSQHIINFPLCLLLFSLCFLFKRLHLLPDSLSFILFISVVGL